MTAPEGWKLIRSLEQLARRLGEHVGLINATTAEALAERDQAAVDQLDRTHAALREQQEQLTTVARARRWLAARGVR